MADDTLKKIGTLIQALRENQAHGYELVEEINKLLEGGPGISAMMKRVEGVFATLWFARYHSKYLWNYAKDRAQEKRLLAKIEIEDLERRMADYIRDNDAFYVKERHPFGLFASSVNRYVTPSHESELELVPAPSDCKHQPRCKSDQEHTRRRSIELRA